MVLSAIAAEGGVGRKNRHDPVGGSSGRSVVHTPRCRETGRPRAAQFAPRPAYIPGGGEAFGELPGPEARYEQAEAISLAFVTGPRREPTR